jgi:hypothetical protein
MIATIVLPAAMTLVVVAVVVAALVASRFPRRLKVQLVRQVISPVVLTLSRKSPPVFSGTPWNEDWEPLATAAALQAAATSAAQGHSVAIVAFDNRPLRRSSLPFAYQDFADPSLERLRLQLGLDNVVAGATSDLDAFRRLSSFVRSVGEHTEESDSNQISYGPPFDAFSILRAAANGQTFQCNAYTLLLIQCLAAMGHVGRQSSCGYWQPREHVVVEAWSSSYGKWVLLDVDYDLTYVKDDLPLSAYDVQQAALDMERRFREWTFDTGLPASRDYRFRQRQLGEFLTGRSAWLDGVRAVRGTAQSARIPTKLALSPTACSWNYTDRLRCPSEMTTSPRFTHLVIRKGRLRPRCPLALPGGSPTTTGT